MKSFSVIAGLTLMLRFCGSNGERFLTVTTLVDQFFESIPQESLRNKHSELPDLEKTCVCFQIPEAKIIIPNTPDLYTNDLYRSNQLFQLLQKKITEFEASNIHITYNNFTNIPVLSCKFDKIVIYITYSEYADLYFIFVKPLDGTKNMLLASYTSYLEVGETEKEIVNLLQIPKNNYNFMMLKLMIFCASLFENFSPAEIKYSPYIINTELISRLEAYPIFINMSHTFRQITSFKCNGFIPLDGDNELEQFITYSIGFYEQNTDKLVIISHNNEYSVLHEKLLT